MKNSTKKKKLAMKILPELFRDQKCVKVWNKYRPDGAVLYLKIKTLIPFGGEVVSIVPGVGYSYLEYDRINPVWFTPDHDLFRWMYITDSEFNLQKFPVIQMSNNFKNKSK